MRNFHEALDVQLQKSDTHGINRHRILLITDEKGCVVGIFYAFNGCRVCGLYFMAHDGHDHSNLAIK